MVLAAILMAMVMIQISICRRNGAVALTTAVAHTASLDVVRVDTGRSVSCIAAVVSLLFTVVIYIYQVKGMYVTRDSA